MADQFARDAAARRIADDHASYADAAQRLARDTRHLADALTHGTDPRSGDANAIAQAALQLAAQAARLQGLHDGTAYLGRGE